MPGSNAGAGWPHGEWAVCLDPEGCRRCRARRYPCLLLWRAGGGHKLLLAVRLERRPTAFVVWRDE